MPPSEALRPLLVYHTVVVVTNAAVVTFDIATTGIGHHHLLFVLLPCPQK